MKKYVTGLAVLLSCVLFLSGCKEKPHYEVYQYPIRPGTEEWKTVLGDHGKMCDACQLPEEWLEKDTTTLLACVLDYPLLSDIWAWADMYLGIHMVADQFNGLEEYLKREDRKEAALAFELPDEKNIPHSSAVLALRYFRMDEIDWVPPGHREQYTNIFTFESDE